MILPYWKLETFNDKLNAVIAFIKAYWRPLLKANMLIAGPPFIIGIGLILYYSNIAANMFIANPDDPNWKTIVGLVIAFIIGGLLYGIAILSITMVTFEVIKVQNERPEKLNDLKYILKNVRQRVLKMFGLMLLSLPVSYILSLVSNLITLPIISGAALLSVLFIPVYFFAYVAVYSYMYILAPTAYYEKISMSKTIKKGIGLVKHRFWQTAGMFAGTKLIQTIIISGVVVPIIGGLFAYFAYKEQFGGGVKLFTPEGQQYLIYLILFLTFFYLALSLFSNIFHIISGAVQYYTLKEEKENPYIFHNIDNFKELGIDE